MKKLMTLCLTLIMMPMFTEISVSAFNLPDIEMIKTLNPDLNIDKVIDEIPKDASLKDPNLVLVNRENPIDSSLDVPLTYTENDIPYHQEIEEAVLDLFTAALDADHHLYAVSGYRTVDQQAANFDARMNLYLADGYDEETAYYMTDLFVAPAEASEHSTGLALDLLGTDWDQYGGDLHQAYKDYPSAIWMAEHAADYGFIIRYLDGKQEITQYEYEPWHLRYVRVEHAQIMMKHNLVLEEYLTLIQHRDDNE
ncbi:M15 family metallopeptidase [Aerococcaceae bacterium DSM 111020]|nr:M15 family metallopeptidase [Aerococcaceae bacterium DSM 111020]